MTYVTWCEPSHARDDVQRQLKRGNGNVLSCLVITIQACVRKIMFRARLCTHLAHDESILTPESTSPVLEKATALELVG